MIDQSTGIGVSATQSKSSAGLRISDGELSAKLRALRAIANCFDTDGQLNTLVSSICRAVHRLEAEHAGMARELLGLYEQIGIVFEVTRHLPKVRNESAVIDLFVDNLRCSFQRHDVFFVSTHARNPLSVATRWDGNSPAASDENETGASAWLRTLVDQGRGDGAVLVADAPPELAPTNSRELLIGPIFAGDRSTESAYVGSIVVTRHEEADPFRARDMRLVESLTTFCGDLIRNHRLADELQSLSVATVQSLVNAVDQKDPYTCGHSLRVAHYACLLGRELELPLSDLEMLRWSALLHDVGKIGIREDVLNKAGRLTDEEFEHIKEHPVRSYEVVKEVPQLAGALDGVLHHHERYDGSGYPSGLSGGDIPLQARIIQIGDIFDALTSSRSYRSAYTWRDALNIMNNDTGKTIDPMLMARFDTLIRTMVASFDHGWEDLCREANRSTILDDSRFPRISEA